MTEQIIVTYNGNRVELDLNERTGITLSFNSNLFTAIDKISCSHSYTIKLPKTQKNCRAFQHADMVQVKAEIAYKVLKAEYILNGLTIFKDANIYLDSCDDYFHAVLTWDFIPQLQQMVSDGLKINELESSTDNRIMPLVTNASGPITERTGDINLSNVAAYLRPQYDCGVERVSIMRAGHQGVLSDVLYPLPVVPVVRLLSLMESKYHIQFDFYENIQATELDSYDTAEALWDAHDNGIDLAVIPCCSVGISDDLAALYSFTGKGLSKAVSYNGKVSNCAWFTDATLNTSSEIGTMNLYNTSTKPTLYGWTPKSSMSLKASGKVVATLVGSSDSASLKFVQYVSTGLGTYEVVDLGSVEGEYTGKITAGGKTCGGFIFDFRKTLNNEAALENIVQQGAILVQFSAEVYSLDSVTDIVFTPSFEEGTTPHKMVANYCLPDVKCIDLLKHIFYMKGAFPRYSEGVVELVSYLTIKNNRASGNVYNWSKKLDSNKYVDMRYKTDEFARTNIYKTASDTDEESDDVYRDGRLSIVTNSIDNEEKEIFTSPFCAYYLKNGKSAIPTGQTFKYWSKETGYSLDAFSAEKAKPCYGLLGFEAEYDSEVEQYTGKFFLTMSAWGGFSAQPDGSAYEYLQEILEYPVKIKVNVYLNEFDLLNLDYAKPVYLEQYNAYFAILKIEYSAGVSKVELIKLP